MMQEKVVTAFVGFGEINSPKQLVVDKCDQALEEIRGLGFDIITTGPVTDDPGGKDVERALDALKGREFDLLIICIAGWIPSHAVISVTDRFKNKPIVLWGLAGDREDDGHIVTMAAQAGTTALRKVFHELGYKFLYVYNMIDRPSPLERIRGFGHAALAARLMESAKIGMMGFRDMRLYNTLYEGLSLKSTLGMEVEFFDTLEMLQASGQAPENEVLALLEEIKKDWHFEKPVDEAFLKQGITYYLGVREIAILNGFHAVSLKDVDGMKKILRFPPAMIFMLIADKMNICAIPENDVMGSVTQLLVKRLTGQCGAYLEFYEFFEKSVLMGVPDFVPAEVVEGKVTVTSAAFGGISGGLLNISTMKTGPLTIVRLYNEADRYFMHIAKGEGKLASWEEAGWTRPAPQLPSLEIFLETPMETFAQHIAGQHYILAYGDHEQALKDFCYLKNIKVI